MDMSKYAVKNHKVLSSYTTVMTHFERGHQAEVVTVKEDMVLVKYWAPHSMVQVIVAVLVCAKACHYLKSKRNSAINLV